MKNHSLFGSKGFTLVELLVVIATIGLLSSIVLTSINVARARARDARRREDLKQVANALELYLNSHNGYPSTGNNWWGNCSGYGSHDTSGANGWVPDLAPTDMPILPVDPKPGPGSCYLYNSNGIDYKLLAYQTTESVCPVPSTDAMWDPVRNGQCTLQISTPGARATW